MDNVNVNYLKKEEEQKQKIHQLQQEDYKRKIEKEEEIIIRLHPAGGFDRKTGFVCEPIGDIEYVFFYKGLKGKAKTKEILKAKCHSCSEDIISLTTIKGTGVLKCPSCKEVSPIEKKEYLLDIGIENLKIFFEDTPLKKPLFHIPARSSLEFWLHNFLVDEKNEEITHQYVFKKLKEFFLNNFDFPIEFSADMIALSCIQSWLIEIIDTLFYVTTVGDKGTGKSALLEAMSLVCRHGVIASDIKSAGIARCQNKYKLSLFIDEIDELRKQDPDIEGICRRGYRKGQFYIRMAPKTHEPEFFDPYGFKAFSFRTEISDDLQQRSINIPMTTAKDNRIPIINFLKSDFNPFELCFFWYLENVAFIYSQTQNFNNLRLDEPKEVNNLELNEPVNHVNTVNKINIVNVNVNIGNGILYLENRDSLIRKAPYLQTVLTVFTKLGLKGRNLEVGYLIISLAETLKFALSEIIFEAMKSKQQWEDASKEVGWVGLLREILIEEFNFSEMKDGIRISPYSKIMKSYFYKMKDVFGDIPSEHQLKKLLRQLGFVDGINRKVIRLGDQVRLCLIYDESIKKNLGVT